jgi:hypothetical protein
MTPPVTPASHGHDASMARFSGARYQGEEVTALQV